MDNVHNVVYEPETEVVLVKMRKLACPALVLKRKGGILELKMSAKDSVKIISVNYFKTFY